MNFTQLRAFHAVAREASFTRGALRLGLSQPAVTVQVRGLEQAYGVQLFRRRGQSVTLTPFGEQVYRQARRVFAQLDDVQELLASAGELRRGTLTVGADGPYVVMALLAAFTRRFPEIRVTVRFGNAERVRADLEAGRTDAAVVILSDPPAGLATLPLRADHLIAFVRRDERWRRRRRIALQTLADEPLVLREPGSATRALLLQACRAAGILPRVALELGSREAVREAVAAGLGLGVIFEGELGRDPRLHRLRLGSERIGAAHVLCCHAEREDLRIVRALFALAHEQYQGRGAAAGGT